MEETTKIIRTEDYFILNPLEDKVARLALRTYLDKVEDKELSNDIYKFLREIDTLEDLEKLLKDNGYSEVEINTLKYANGADCLKDFLTNLKAEQNTARIYKVIKVDNYDRELYDDKLIKENLTLGEAEELSKTLNETRYDADYYIAVPNSRKLFVFEP